MRIPLTALIAMVLCANASATQFTVYAGEPGDPDHYQIHVSVTDNGGCSDLEFRAEITDTTGVDMTVNVGPIDVKRCTPFQVSSITFDGGGTGTAGIFKLVKAFGVMWGQVDSLSDLSSSSYFKPDSSTELDITDGSAAASVTSKGSHFQRTSVTGQPLPRRMRHSWGRPVPVQR